MTSYSGVGLFTAFLAEPARFVTAVELYAPAVRDAEVNLLGLTNVDLRVGTIEGALPREVMPMPPSSIRLAPG